MRELVAHTQDLTLSPRLEYSHNSVIVQSSGHPPTTASQVVGTRLECSGVISGHYYLCLLGSRKEFHHTGQAGLKLLTSSDPLTSASQSSGITGVSHCARSTIVFLIAKTWLEKPQEG
ncbi:hypothetical protein AAY473_031689, partial [Plecturocebus cupreus]